MQINIHIHTNFLKRIGNLLCFDQNARAEFTYAFDSINKDIICCHTVGQYTEAELFETMDKCKQASQHIFDFYRNLVKKYANVI